MAFKDSDQFAIKTGGLTELSLRLVTVGFTQRIMPRPVVGLAVPRPLDVTDIDLPYRPGKIIKSRRFTRRMNALDM